MRQTYYRMPILAGLLCLAWISFTFPIFAINSADQGHEVVLDVRAGLDTVQIRWRIEEQLNGMLHSYRLTRAIDSSPATVVYEGLKSIYIDQAAWQDDTQVCYLLEALDSEQRILGTSAEQCTQIGTLELSVPEVVLDPLLNEQSVPVQVRNADGFCIVALDVTITYDDAIVQAVDVTNTAYTSAYTFFENLTPGQIKIATISSPSSCVELSGTGELFHILFRPVGSPGQLSSLSFIDGITSTVAYDDDDLTTPIDMQLVNGSAELTLNYMRGDVNGDSIINSGDAAFANQLALGLQIGTARQRAACDVNGDRLCTSADSTVILCYAAFASWHTCGLRSVQRQTTHNDAANVSLAAIDEHTAELRLSGRAWAGGHVTLVYDSADVRLSDFRAVGPLLNSVATFDVNQRVPGLVQIGFAASGPNTTNEVAIARFNLEQLSNQDVVIRLAGAAIHDASGYDFESNLNVPVHLNDDLTLSGLGPALKAQSYSGVEDIQLRWQIKHALPETLAAYRISRSTNGSSYLPIATEQIDSHYLDQGQLVKGNTYCYIIEAFNELGHTVGQSNTSCTQFGQLILTIPHVVFEPNSLNQVVPIQIANGNRLCISALDIMLTYDQQVVQASGMVTPTAYTAGYQFVANTTLSNQVKISAQPQQGSCAELAGAGELFHIGFHTVDMLDSVSTIDFIEGLEATVLYGDNEFTTPLDLQLLDGSILVDVEYIRGDVNGDGHINAADAFLALQIASELLAPTRQQQYACDVNGDRACNAADASVILCYAAYQKWTACGLPNREVDIEPQDHAHLRLDGHILSLSAEQFAGGEIILMYDPSIVTIEHVLPLGALAEARDDSSQFAYHVKAPGLLHIVFSAASPRSATGEIIALHIPENADVSSLQIVESTLHTAEGLDFETNLGVKINPAVPLMTSLSKTTIFTTLKPINVVVITLLLCAFTCYYLWQKYKRTILQ